MWLLWTALGALSVFLAVILIRTALFRPAVLPPAEATPCDFDREAAHRALAELVRCRTVSRYTAEDEDDAEFRRLLSLLPTLYPHFTAACEMRQFDGRGLLFRWEGRTHTPATVMMAHYDVVPADESGWRHPPFDAVSENGVMWGRGTLDTKSTMNAALFAADTLIARGFVPSSDIYFAFSGSEEVGGAGAPNIVSYFRSEGIDVGLVLDEGGGVVEGAFPGVKAPTAMVGIAEKGMLDLEYRVRTAGGHASAPRPLTAIGHLAEACTTVTSHPPRMRISPPARKMFRILGRHSTFLYRMIFANLWCFGWVLGVLGRKKGGDVNALIRTTVAFTRMQGSDANNVLPTEATMVSNIRLVPGDTVNDTIARLRRVIDDERVELRPLLSVNPSRVSRTDGDGWERVAAAVRATWPTAVVTPYLMVQCSDSRHWGDLTDCVYRFSAMDFTAEERRTIHGHNERIRLESIDRSVSFYLRLLENC